MIHYLEIKEDGNSLLTRFMPFVFWKGGGKWKGGRENLEQAHCPVQARCGAQSHNPEITT